MNSVLKYFPILILLVFFSCKSRKKFAAPKKEVVGKDTIVEGSKVNVCENLLSPTLKSWTYFSAKADIEFTQNDDKKNVGSNIRMYKDSLIWISVNLFGIEGARILVNKDSMVMIDKLNKKYTVFNKTYIETMLGSALNVSELQNLILAKPIYSLSLYQMLMNSETNLKIRCTQPKVLVSHEYQKQLFTIDSTLIEDRTAPHYALIKYSKFASVNEHNFPMKNEITAYNGTSLVNIVMEFANPDFITTLSFPFTIPASYERSK